MNEATFVLCIENTGIRAQALLLCASIRAFGGRLRTAPILAIAPRPGLGVTRRTRRALEALDVEYVETPLNQVCPDYGSANRVFAARWAEDRSRSEWLIVLDSDTVWLDEPALPPAADVILRPVDSKGSASTGPADPFDAYWRELATLAGTTVEALPFVSTTDGGHRVRASYNGGLVVARRATRLLTRWADLFARSVAAGLKPWRGCGHNVRASTGHVGLAASEYWGSNQAALAVTVWGARARVAEYPDTYNVPLHLLAERPDLVAARRRRAPVHVHYHWMFARKYHRAALDTLRSLGTGPDRLDWLAARLPLAWSGW